MKTGYARASAYGQSLKAQRQKLRQEGCARILEEKASALPEKKDELEKALKSMREGDVLVVTKLDRLASSLQDLLGTTKRLREKGLHLKVIDQSIDTTILEGRQMFNIIGPFAEFEHDIRKARQLDGIRKARDNGVVFGRKHALSDEQRRQIVRLSRDEGLSLKQLANKYAVSHMTVYRVLKRAPAQEACIEGTSGQPQPAVQDEHPTIYSSYG